MNDILRFTVDPVTLTASAGKPSKLKILAYCGGPMRVEGFGLVCINLAGLNLPDSVPILSDHENRLDSVIGAGSPEIRDLP